MVTDLDGHLTERALASLGAELRRRELLLAEVGAKDIEGYWRAAGHSRSAAGPPADRHRRVRRPGRGAAELRRRAGRPGPAGPVPRDPPDPGHPATVGGGVGRHQDQHQPAHRHAGHRRGRQRRRHRLPVGRPHPQGSARPGLRPGRPRGAERVPGRPHRRPPAARRGGRAWRCTTSAGPTWAMPSPSPNVPALADDATDLSELVSRHQRRPALRLGHRRRHRARGCQPCPKFLPLGGGRARRTRCRDGPGRAGRSVRRGGPPGRAGPAGRLFDVERDGHLLGGRAIPVGPVHLATHPGRLTGSPDVSTARRPSVWDRLRQRRPAAHRRLPHCGAVVTRREPDRVDRLLTKLLAEVTRRQQVLAQGGFATIADQRSAAAARSGFPYVVSSSTAGRATTPSSRPSTTAAWSRPSCT